MSSGGGRIEIVQMEQMRNGTGDTFIRITLLMSLNLYFTVSHRSESIVGHPEYKTTMRLTITSVDEEDDTSYKCVAKNPRGESEGTIRLYGEYIFNVSSSPSTPSPLPLRQL